MFTQTQQPALEIYIGDFENFLLVLISLKAHTYYPTYDIGAYISD